MKKVDVLILFEHKSREFESACLLKYDLEKRGLTVVIEGTFPNREILPIKYKVKYLFTPWYYTGTKYVANFLKYSPDAIIINLHHEQYTIENSDILVPKGEARNVYHLCWGDAFKDQLLSVGCSKDLIINAGNIRLDVFKGELKRLSPSKSKLSEDFNLDSSKKWCLFIADSAHLLEPYQLEVEALGNYKEVFKASNLSREAFLNYVENYLSCNNDVVFIYRPHPCMANKDLSSNDLINLHNKYPNNFFAIYKYPINCWLINCDICFSFISSSLIECYFARTHYYLFRSTSISKDLDFTFFHEFKYIVCNYNEFETSLKSEEYDFNYVEEKLKYWYNMSDDYTFKKIDDFVLKIRNHHNVIKYKKRDWYHNLIEAFFKSLIIQIGKVSPLRKLLFLIKDNRINRILGDTEDVVNQKEVEAFMKRLDEIHS